MLWVALPRCWIVTACRQQAPFETNISLPFPTDRLCDRSQHSHTSIARRALSPQRYRIANFALQRTFRFAPVGLAFCFFPFSNTHIIHFSEFQNCGNLKMMDRAAGVPARTTRTCASVRSLARRWPPSPLRSIF